MADKNTDSRPTRGFFDNYSAEDLKGMREGRGARETKGLSSNIVYPQPQIGMLPSHIPGAPQNFNYKSPVTGEQKQIVTSKIQKPAARPAQPKKQASSGAIPVATTITPAQAATPALSLQPELSAQERIQGISIDPSAVKDFNIEGNGGIAADSDGNAFVLPARGVAENSAMLARQAALPTTQPTTFANDPSYHDQRVWQAGQDASAMLAAAGGPKRLAAVGEHAKNMGDAALTPARQVLLAAQSAGEYGKVANEAQKNVVTREGNVLTNKAALDQNSKALEGTRYTADSNVKGHKISAGAAVDAAKIGAEAEGLRYKMQERAALDKILEQSANNIRNNETRLAQMKLKPDVNLDEVRAVEQELAYDRATHSQRAGEPLSQQEAKAKAHDALAKKNREELVKKNIQAYINHPNNTGFRSLSDSAKYDSLKRNGYTSEEIRKYAGLA